MSITACCPNQFVQVNPTTGGLTILSQVGDATFAFSPSSAVDPATHSFYIVRVSPDDSQPHVVAINTQTGVLVENPAISQRIFALGFDASLAVSLAVPTVSPRALVALALAIAGVALILIRRS